jgi:hypothetical protein
MLTRRITEKHLQALRALNFARAINPNHPSLHVRVVDLRQNGMSPLALTSQCLIYPL